MANTPKPTDQPNEGEGNRTYAKVYNDATRRFAQSGKVEPAAKEAEKSLSREGAELEKAENAGKKPAHHEREI
jgi:hypothetical protein